jgi:hypothetical protein
MNLNGWVQLRRGILDHLRDGRLSIYEFLVLIVLIMLADKCTGRGTINAPTLRCFVPELSKDAAKRVLNSLEEKRYIYRKIIPFSKVVYPFWVNRFIPSAGPHKGLQIDLAKVFESKDIKDIAYIDLAPHNAPEGAPEGAPDPAHNYKTREVITNKRNKPTINSSESASVCAASENTESPSAAADAKQTVKRASALPCALPNPAVGSSPREAQRRADVSIPHTQTTVHADISRMSAEDYFKHIGRQVGGDWSGITANQFFSMSAEGLFKHVGTQLEGDWHGITANQLLTFDAKKIPRVQALDARMKWQPNLDTYVDSATGKPVSLPDAIRRVESVQPPQPQTAA